MADDESYWAISVRWGKSLYRDAPEHILDYLAGRYATYNAAHNAAQIVTGWARIPLERAKISYRPASAPAAQVDEDYWAVAVRWGQPLYRDAPEHIRDCLAGRYATYEAAHNAAQLVTQWARLPFERAKISHHGPVSKS